MRCHFTLSVDKDRDYSEFCLGVNTPVVQQGREREGAIDGFVRNVMHPFMFGSEGGGGLVGACNQSAAVGRK